MNQIVFTPTVWEAHGFIPLNGRILMLPAKRDPLSAEVFVIRGDSALWCFDTGCGAAALQALHRLPHPRYAVISHFHPDHMGNAMSGSFDRVYLGPYAMKKASGPQCICVEQAVSIPDGVRLRILPLPSSHAKGSLMLEADNCLFTGDGLYAAARQDMRCYNVTVLRDTLSALEHTVAPFIVQSHQNGRLEPRALVMDHLKTIYDKRRPGERLIPL